jgi:hypothetical protein
MESNNYAKYMKYHEKNEMNGGGWFGDEIKDTIKDGIKKSNKDNYAPLKKALEDLQTKKSEQRIRDGLLEKANEKQKNNEDTTWIWATGAQVLPEVIMWNRRLKAPETVPNIMIEVISRDPNILNNNSFSTYTPDLTFENWKTILDKIPKEEREIIFIYSLEKEIMDLFEHLLSQDLDLNDKVIGDIEKVLMKKEKDSSSSLTNSLDMVIKLQEQNKEKFSTESLSNLKEKIQKYSAASEVKAEEILENMPPEEKLESLQTMLGEKKVTQQKLQDEIEEHEKEIEKIHQQTVPIREEMIPKQQELKQLANEIQDLSGNAELIPKPEEQPQEETKPEETKPEEVKPEETKQEETKPEEVKQEETKQEEVKPEEVKPEEVKPEEVKPEEVKPEEVKPEEVKPEEVKPEEVKPEEVKPEEVKPEEVKPEETKQEEVKPEETKPEEVKPEETKPEEIKQDGGLNNILADFIRQNMAGGSKSKSKPKSKSRMNSLVKYIKKQNKQEGGGKNNALVDYIKKQM